MALKKKAQQVRRAGSKNSNQDSMLAHISPQEAGLLKAYGGSGRTDPQTGLPHFDGDPGLGDPGVADGIGVPADPSEPSSSGDFQGVDVSGLPNDNVGFDNGDMSLVSANDVDPAVLASLTSDDETTISKMFKGIPATIAKGLAGHMGIPGTIAGPAIGAITGQAPATPSQALGSFAGMGLAGLGGIVGGPVGAAIGGLAGNAIGGSIGAPPSMSAGDISAANAATSDPSNSSGQNMLSDFLNGPGLAGMGGLLGQLYNSNQQSKLYGGTMDTINNLYSPDSPYAQQMRQAMERKDAASGRRSQYGTRETQLAAALTQARSNALTSAGYGAMLKGQANANQQLPAYLLSLAKTNWGQNMLGKAGRSISDYYASGNNSNYSNEGLNYPNYSGGMGGGNYSNEGLNYPSTGTPDYSGWNNGWGEG
jgi:hypothetical protein